MYSAVRTSRTELKSSIGTKITRTAYTFGRSIASPDFENTGCVVLWGHDPSATWLDHATATTAARRNGARIIVVEPRRAGFAAGADQWLRVRPGSDGALRWVSLAILCGIGPMDLCWFRTDTQRFLRAGELAKPPIDAQAEDLLAWDAAQNELVAYSIPQRTCSRICKKELYASVEPILATGETIRCRSRLWSLSRSLRRLSGRHGRAADLGRRSPGYRNGPAPVCVPPNQLLRMVGRRPAHQCYANRPGNIPSYGINRQL